jgi:hypothetical protein
MHSASPDDPGGTPQGGASVHRIMPDALRGPQFDRVRDAWREACELGAPDHPALVEALRALARRAREQHLEVAAVLKALDAVIRADRGGEPALDWDHMREIAGGVVIRAFYRDD